MLHHCGLPSIQGVAAQAPSEEEESGTVLMKIAQSLGFFIGKARRGCNIYIFAITFFIFPVDFSSSTNSEQNMFFARSNHPSAMFL